MKNIFECEQCKTQKQSTIQLQSVQVYCKHCNQFTLHYQKGEQNGDTIKHIDRARPLGFAWNEQVTTWKIENRKKPAFYKAA